MPGGAHPACVELARLPGEKSGLQGYRELFNEPFMSEYRKLILRLADLRKTPRPRKSSMTETASP